MPYFPPILSDPQLGISKKEQNLILGTASSEWMRNKRNVALYIGVIILWASTIAVGKVLINQMGTITAPYQVLLWIATFILFILGSHYLVFHVKFKRYLYQELRNRGHEICPECSYILFTLPKSETTCPECGTARSPLPDQTKSKPKPASD